MSGDGNGRRVLVVEDDALFALFLEEILCETGYEVVGPAATLADAWELTREEEDLDLALLDVNLGEDTVFPVARALAEEGVPFAFLTANERGSIPADFGNTPVMRKPISLPVLLTMVDKASSRRVASPQPVPARSRCQG